MRKTAAIVGVGLIGGSLGRALRRRGWRVIGLGRRPATLRRARRIGAIDVAATEPAAVAQADWVILCTPVSLIVPAARRLLPFLKPHAWITDVGSVKTSIVRDMERLLRGRTQRFVGSHPLAGSHRTGVEASRPDLLQKAICVITPCGHAPLGPALKFWRSVGARPLVMKAEDHDRALALTSHLPHLIAHALVQGVMRDPNRRRLMALMAGSFRDVTRVAGADPEQWAQIFENNQAALRRSLSIFLRDIRRLNGAIRSPRDLRRRLSQSSRFRRPLFEGAR